MHVLTRPQAGKSPRSPLLSSSGKRTVWSIIVSLHILGMLLSVDAGTYVTTVLRLRSVTQAAPSSTAVTTSKNDLLRTGQNTNEIILNTSNANQKQFGKRVEYEVDGQVYAQPLYLPNVNIGSTAHNVVFVATEHDSLYAFDADQSSSTPISTFLWKRSFIDPLRNITTVSSSDVNCQDINPEYGITSTPVIDPSTNTLYVVVNTLQSGVNTYQPHADPSIRAGKQRRSDLRSRQTVESWRFVAAQWCCLYRLGLALRQASIPWLDHGLQHHELQAVDGL